MKTLADKRINRKVKKINKTLREDVFGDRFYVKQIQKDRNYNTYLYMVCDKQHPENNKIVEWCNEFSIYLIWRSLNALIVESDFWKKWRERNVK